MLTTLALVSLAVLVQQAAPVELQPGANSLLEVGRYRVAYQRPGGEWQSMPEGWSGHFAPNIGISCTGVGAVAGKQALLLHPVWMGGPGQVELSYAFQLPAETPITLRFAYAMDPSRAEKSDGVHFQVRVMLTNALGEPITVLDATTKSTEWQDVDYDLSRFAGKAVEVVFHTDPGPKDDPGFDFSLFGDPRILVGAAEEPTLTDRLARIRELRAKWDPHRPNLSDLAGSSGVGAAPVSAARGVNTVSQTGPGSWAFTYQGRDCKVTYTAAANRDGVTLYAMVDSLPTIPLGRVPTATADGKPVEWTGTGAVFDAAGRPGLELVGATHGGQVSLPMKCTLSVVGKSLVIDAESPVPGIEDFSASAVGAVAWRKEVSVPYLTGGRYWYLPDQSVYVGSILDWTASSASYTDGLRAVYGSLSDKSRIPLRERAIVTVSPYLHEVFPSIPNPASPYREDLSRRVIVDDWCGNFDATRKALDTYASYGLENLLVQVHAWQHSGYDVKLPDVLPANEGCGGDNGFIALSQTAAKHGYLFGVHENYVDLYPDAASWDEKLVARNADGSMVPAWYNEGTKVQSFGYRADAIVPTAERFTPEVHKRFGTTMAYLDVHSAVPPWFHVDFTAGQPVAGRFLPVWDAHCKLWEYFRKVHGGPVLGEGANHWYWSGRLDGVEAQVGGGELHQVFADFDLVKIHPLQLNHGMGYNSRWLIEGYGAGAQSKMPLVRADKYRTQEILYGHAGWIDPSWVLEPLLAVKEAWVMAPLQSRYGAAKVTDISYLVAGEWVDGSTALALGKTDVVRATYDSGLTVTVNQSPETVTLGGIEIPQYGFSASGAGITSAYTAIRDGQIVDYVADDKSTMADARGLAYHAGTDVLPMRAAAAEVTPVGPREFGITYNWKVEGPLPALDNAVAFVHFTNPKANDRPDAIVFQDDHQAPTDLTPGEHGDGPRRVRVPDGAPAGTYKVVVGIYVPQGARYTLRGPDDGGQRYQVAQVKVAEDGTVTLVHAGPPEGAPEPFAIYSERYNTERRVIDFGPILTNGAVRIVREEGAVRVYPLPQGKEFTIALRPERLSLKGDSFQVTGLDAEGKEVSSVRAEVADGRLALTIGAEGVCSYKVRSA